MEIRNCQTQPMFKAHLKELDNKGLHNLGVLDDVIKMLPSIKKVGNDNMTLSFYATERGNVGVYCEEKFMPKGGIFSGALFKTVAKGDGFVYKNEFLNFKEKLSMAIQKAVKSCSNSTNGRYIAKEKQIEAGRKLAKDTARNNKLLSLCH